MKNIRGILLITVAAAITLVLWFLAAANQSLGSLDAVSHMVAGLSLTGFSLNFLLATRNKTLEKWFNGFDKLYIYHKYIALSTVGLLLVHTMLADLLKTTELLALNLILGDLAMGLLVVGVGITLFAKKLPYEKWRVTHKLLIVPYLFGLFHAYTTSHIDLVKLSPLGIWTGATAIVGILSAIYIVFFYQKTQFKHKGTVTKISKLNSNVIEWEITLTRSIQFIKGQFIFIKVFQSGLEDAPHPFSISGGDENKIRLTTKNSGDFTGQLYDSLRLGTKVAINGPYGLMDFDRGKKNQIWVAGGIGITPFLAYMSKESPLEQTIDFYYSFQGAEAGIYKDFIEDYQSKNHSFTAHFIDTAVMPFLSFEGVPIENENDISIFMCGPEKMIKGYVKFFNQNYKGMDINYEAFSLK